MSDDGLLREWAHLRFAIVGRLLANPPKKGDLQRELEALASCRYPHPTKEGEFVSFGASTIERWYYKALGSSDPVGVLARKLRLDRGLSRIITSEVLDVLHQQYREYPNWSYQLHADNLAAYLAQCSTSVEAPSYSTIRREMRKRGWNKARIGRPKTPGQKRARERLDSREVRSFEAEYVHALWHLDFHEGSRRVVDAGGSWHTPNVVGMLDDRSRLCCHIQWYFRETAENLIHGLSQAFQKRGLPRSLLTDNGSAMLAGETQNGLMRLGIVHDKTLAYSPYQNGKQESFWGQLEGRLLAMLSRVEPLTLEFLNLASQAWAEQEYNRAQHEEIKTAPLDRLLEGPSVARPSPDAETLRLAFTAEKTRVQRRSDGTVKIKGIRFEIPSRFRHMDRLCMRYQSWDLSVAYLVDEKTGSMLSRIYPQDKTQNANGLRRSLEALPECPTQPASSKTDPIPPLLRKILTDYAATGLPPAFIPKDENIAKGENNVQ